MHRRQDAIGVEVVGNGEGYPSPHPTTGSSRVSRPTDPVRDSGNGTNCLSLLCLSQNPHRKKVLAWILCAFLNVFPYVARSISLSRLMCVYCLLGLGLGCQW